jgi:ATP-binding cassette subfamily B protein
MEAAAASFGMEAEPIDVAYGDFARFVRSAGPALFRGADGGLIAIDAGGRVRGRDGRRRRVAPALLRSRIFRSGEERAAEDADRLLTACAVAERRRPAVRRAIAATRLQQSGETRRCWQLRAPPAAAFWPHLRSAGVPRRVAMLGAAHAAEYLVWIAAWVLVGHGALRGQVDPGWLLGWAVLLFTLIPLRVGVTWLQGQIAIRGGGLLKERMLYGALRLDPDETRHRGAGHLLGRVIETDAMESLALGGGFLALVSGVEILAAAAIAIVAAGSTLIPALLGTWIAVTFWIVVRYFGHCSRWAAERLAMTDDLVERMAGHRTRLAQEPPESWHEREDHLLEGYLAASERLDASAPWMAAFVARGWLVVGIAGVAASFVGATGITIERLAAELGALLLASRGFRKLGAGAPLVVQAVVAARQAIPLLAAAQQAEASGSAALAGAAAKPVEREIVLEGRDLVFRHSGRLEPTLRGCNLQIQGGDRILLDGPSGSGKSTLAAVLAGVRTPAAGVLLADGLDRSSLGADGWRRKVAMAPQFHENHLVTGPLAFNLLLGRSGSLGDADLHEAEAVCEELGLGDLLRRMPAGIMQQVGEGGWQLSHGERSRVYVARALLQEANVVVLDEGFAALDAVNLRRAIDCVDRRANAVLAIAHH